MVYIPYGTQTPLDPDPVFPLNAEIQVQRNLTHWFIRQDPTDVILIPQTRQRTTNGAYSLGALPPRPPQTVKMIYPFGQSDGAVATQDGTERKYEFIMVGEWNATIKTDDYWQDADGQYWIVTGVSPYNGYEVKAMISSFGSKAKHG